MRRRLRISSFLVAMVAGALIGGDAIGASAAPAPAAPAAPAAPTAPELLARAAARCCHITIPGNYVYNPNTNYQRSLHDYCTSSPDEFPAPGTNANFRGPCARHDMCYQYRQQSRGRCDSQLFRHLEQECTYTYGAWDPRREGCTATAEIYYAAVRLNTLWPF